MEAAGARGQLSPNRDDEGRPLDHVCALHVPHASVSGRLAVLRCPPVTPSPLPARLIPKREDGLS